MFCIQLAQNIFIMDFYNVIFILHSDLIHNNMLHN